jgi:predicted DNA-binding transcriptional regulator YafY
MKNDYRTFKINRMRNVGMRVETFDSQSYQPPEIEPADNLLFDTVELELLFSPQAAFRVYDEFDERDIIQGDGGWLSVTIRMPDDYWLYSYIFSYGEFLEVLRPQSVRDEIALLAGRIKNKYSNKT